MYGPNPGYHNIIITFLPIIITTTHSDNVDSLGTFRRASGSADFRDHTIYDIILHHIPIITRC